MSCYYFTIQCWCCCFRGGAATDLFISYKNGKVAIACINTFENNNSIVFIADMNKSVISKETKQLLIKNGLMDIYSYYNRDY